MDARRRAQVRERAENRCEYCQLHQDDSPLAALHLEHIIPQVHGVGVNGSVAKQGYHWLPDMSGTWQGAGGVRGLVGISYKDQGGAAYYWSLNVGYDGNGNVVGLYGDVGGSTGLYAVYEYDPFGNTIRQNVTPAGNSLATTLGENPFRFSTKFTDDESKLIYYGFRYYSAGLGQWLSKDPIEEDGGINLYAMCDNDCVNRSDVLGMKWRKAAKDQQPVDEFRVLWLRDSETDTLEDLAKEIGLDPNESNKWAQKKGKGGACPVSVPNIWIDANLLHGGGPWDRVVNIGGLLGRGFTFSGKKEIKVDHAKDLVSTIIKYKRDIIGFSLYAHGNKDGTIAMPVQTTGKDKRGRPIYDFTRFTSQDEVLGAIDMNGFKLAQAHVMQCYSGFKGKDDDGIERDWNGEWIKRVYKSPKAYQGVNALGIDMRK